METPTEQSNHDLTGNTLAISYDVRVPGISQRLHREHAGWGEYGDIEALDQHHYILVVSPGGVA